MSLRCLRRGFPAEIEWTIWTNRTDRMDRTDRSVWRGFEPGNVCDLLCPIYNCRLALKMLLYFDCAYTVYEKNNEAYSDMCFVFRVVTDADWMQKQRSDRSA